MSCLNLWDSGTLWKVVLSTQSVIHSLSALVEMWSWQAADCNHLMEPPTITPELCPSASQVIQMWSNLCLSHRFSKADVGGAAKFSPSSIPSSRYITEVEFLLRLVTLPEIMSTQEWKSRENSREERGSVQTQCCGMMELMLLLFAAVWGHCALYTACSLWVNSSPQSVKTSD